MWLVKIELTLVPDRTNDDPRSFLDETYVELCKIADHCDPNMIATIQDNEAMFSLLVAEKDRFSAFQQAAANVRTALHAAGGRTPDWEQLVESAFAAARMTSEPAHSHREPAPVYS